MGYAIIKRPQRVTPAGAFFSQAADVNSGQNGQGLALRTSSLLVASVQVLAFQQHQYHAQSDARWRIDIMKSNGESKLEAGEDFDGRK